MNVLKVITVDPAISAFSVLIIPHLLVILLPRRFWANNHLLFVTFVACFCLHQWKPLEEDSSSCVIFMASEAA